MITFIGWLALILFVFGEIILIVASIKNINHSTTTPLIHCVTALWLIAAAICFKEPITIQPVGRKCVNMIAVMVPNPPNTATMICGD